jgi:hypothetical protein
LRKIKINTFLIGNCENVLIRDGKIVCDMYNSYAHCAAEQFMYSNYGFELRVFPKSLNCIRVVDIINFRGSKVTKTTFIACFED